MHSVMHYVLYALCVTPRGITDNRAWQSHDYSHYSLEVSRTNVFLRPCRTSDEKSDNKPPAYQSLKLTFLNLKNQ